MSISDVFTLFPTLYTERLTLRTIVPDDAATLFALYSDPQVTLHLDITTLTQRSEAESLIDLFQRRYLGGDGIRWAISFRNQSELIGTCGFNYLDRENHWGEIGYDLAARFWHQGIMREALQTVLHFGFTVASLNRIEANVTAGNESSAKLLERLGFEKEGVLRQRLYARDIYHDLIYYGLLRNG